MVDATVDRARLPALTAGGTWEDVRATPEEAPETTP